MSRDNPKVVGITGLKTMKDYPVIFPDRRSGNLRLSRGGNMYIEFHDGSRHMDLTGEEFQVHDPNKRRYEWITVEDPGK